MSASKNWKATAIPSIDGRTTKLIVEGEVFTGFVPPKLQLCDDKIKLPENVIAFDLTSVTSAGQPETIAVEADITNKEQVTIVIIFDGEHKIEAAVTIERVLS